MVPPAKVLEPWFPSHPERNAYVTLLQLSDPPASDSLLKAALIRRAMADVRRVIRLKEDKPALQNLLQKGSVGDDLWNSCLAAEKEMEAEIVEVMHEANTFVQGWGQIIFTTAGEMVQNEKLKAMFDQIPKVRTEQGALRSHSVLQQLLMPTMIIEVKYGKKRKVIESSVKTPSTPTTPAPALPATPLAPVPAPATPLPPTPATPAATPAAPSNPSTNGNHLVPPPSVDTESVASSDGELVSPSTPSKSARPTPSKSVRIFTYPAFTQKT